MKSGPAALDIIRRRVHKIRRHRHNESTHIHYRNNRQQSNKRSQNPYTEHLTHPLLLTHSPTPHQQTKYNICSDLRHSRRRSYRPKRQTPRRLHIRQSTQKSMETQNQDRLRRTRRHPRQQRRNRLVIPKQRESHNRKQTDAPSPRRYYKIQP